MTHREDKEKKGIFDTVWSFFASVKLTVVIFILLALTSIIGTIIEQRADQITNVKLLARFFGDSTAPAVYNICVKLGFIDMYHSWWFVALLVVFSVNLIVCSLDRLPKTLRVINNPMNPLSENAVRNMPLKKEFTVKAGLQTAKDAVLNSLRASRYRVMEASEEGGVQLYSQKGRHTRLGVYIVHLSILLIFIGAIIGARFGFGGFLNLPEGESSDVAYAQGGIPIPLGFTIKCNNYDTQYYGNQDMPQEFQSELVIIDNGREVIKKSIEVNDPLTYKGITFYQSSYGMVPGAMGTFILKVTPKGGETKTLRLMPGQAFDIAGDLKATLVDFSPALARDPQTGGLITYSENMVNPAVAVEFNSPGMNKSSGWILKRFPETGNLPGGHKIEFVDYWGVEYTGLQVSKDPGVGLIYLACVVMTIGLFAAFFMSNKKIWVRITGEKGAVKILTGGSASKNKLAFEGEINKILSRAVHAIEGRHSKKNV